MRDAFHFACSPDKIEAAFSAVGAVPLNSAVVLQGGIPLRKGHALPKQRKALNINEEVLSQAEFIQVMRAERKRLEAKGRKKKVKGRKGIHSQEEEREESENEQREANPKKKKKVVLLFLLLLLFLILLKTVFKKNHLQL